MISSLISCILVAFPFFGDLDSLLGPLHKWATEEIEIVEECPGRSTPYPQLWLELNHMATSNCQGPIVYVSLYMTNTVSCLKEPSHPLYLSFGVLSLTKFNADLHLKINGHFTLPFPCQRDLERCRSIRLSEGPSSSASLGKVPIISSIF